MEKKKKTRLLSVRTFWLRAEKKKPFYKADSKEESTYHLVTLKVLYVFG